MPLTTSSLDSKTKALTPALIALLIQLASAIFIFVSLTLLWRTVQFRASPPQIVIAHAALVLIGTRVCNLEWWWCVIQPLFPVAASLMLLLAIPSWLYLILFLFFLVFYWSTYRTQVPYFPSTKKVWLEVEKLLPQDRAFSFVDIGSGLGGLILYLGSRFGSGKFTGVEIAPLPWLASFLRVKLRPTPGVQFLRSNYASLDLREFDVVFAYLSPAAMSALWQKVKQEMRPGSILISYEFPIIGVDPDLSISISNQPTNRRAADQEEPLENMSTNSRKLFVWFL